MPTQPKKDGLRSTGNAIRGSYMSSPSVGINNLVLKPTEETGTHDFKRLMSYIDKGVFITEVLGMHTANPVSGDFSIGISGIYIEKGDYLYPFKEATLSGNILTLFQRVVGIGDDIAFYGNIGTPSLLIEGLDICA
ncbi:MAG: metallopeptidase TldD-related protein [Thermodesulfovibrionales bacterium]